MEQVARAAENGRYLRPFAKIILALAACREKQPELARKLLRQLSEQYPNSVLFASEYAKVSNLQTSSCRPPRSADLLTPANPLAGKLGRQSFETLQSECLYQNSVKFQPSETANWRLSHAIPPRPAL
jgi:hypothetical protein